MLGWWEAIQRGQYVGITRAGPPLPHGLYNRSAPKRLLTPTGVGLPEPATRPIEAKYRAILGPYLLDSRDIAGISDPGTCAPIYLDWQSGEPSPLGTRPSVRRLC